jgi:hypothetical protein
MHHRLAAAPTLAKTSQVMRASLFMTKGTCREVTSGLMIAARKYSVDKNQKIGEKAGASKTLFRLTAA